MNKKNLSAIDRIAIIIQELTDINQELEKQINPFEKLKHYQCSFCNWKGTEKEIYNISGNDENYLVCPVCSVEVDEIKS